MSSDAIRRIEILHEIYCTETNLKLPLDAGRQHQWAYLIIGIRDMECEPEKAVLLVARRVRHLIKTGQLWPSALSFSRFVGRVDEFQERLAEALADGRQPKVNHEYASVMRATGRSAEPKQPEPRNIDEVLNSEAFRAFCDLRKTL